MLCAVQRYLQDLFSTTYFLFIFPAYLPSGPSLQIFVIGHFLHINYIEIMILTAGTFATEKLYLGINVEKDTTNYIV